MLTTALAGLVATLAGGLAFAQDDPAPPVPNAPVSPAGEEEGAILGAPSAFGGAALAGDRLPVPAGTEVRTLPDPRAATLALVDVDTELPVLERRGGWSRVRYGALTGWVALDPRIAPAAGAGLLLPGPDPELLARSLAAFAAALRSGELGPFALWTDLPENEGDLLPMLDRLAADLPGLYAERYAVPVTEGKELPAAERDAVVLFAREEDYRRFAADAGVADLGEGGIASFGFAALYAGGRDRAELAALLAHELVHMLNARALGPRTPPWLEEGLANDFAYAGISAAGRLHPGSLGGERSIQTREAGAAGRRDGQIEVTVTTGGGRAALGRLIVALDARALPPVDELVSLTWRELVAPEARELAYAHSAFLVRYLLDGAGEARAAGFRAYLAELAGGAANDPAVLREALGLGAEHGWTTLDAGFRRWLRLRALAEGL